MTITDQISGVGMSIVPAANVSITDAGDYYTATNVESALQELGPIAESVVGKLDEVDTIINLRSRTVTQTPIYVCGRSSTGDGGEGTFYGVTGAAIGTYTDDGGTIIVPIGGNGSSAWIRKNNGMQYNVKWFGAKGDGTTNDATAIQNTLNAAALAAKAINSGAQQAPGIVYIPTGVYKVNSSLTVDSYNVSIEGYGWLDFSAMSSGYALRITGTSTVVPWGKRSIIYGCLYLLGPGKSSSVTGIFFDTGSPSPAAQAAGLFEGVSVYGFGIGHEHGYLSYNSTFIGCQIATCGNGIKVNTTNGGERVTYISTTINDCTLAINSLRFLELFFYGCSIDYNFKIADISDGFVAFTDCHLEYSIQPGSSYMVVVGPTDGATFTMKGGYILVPSGTPTTAFINVTTTQHRGGGAFFDGVFMNGLGQTTAFNFSDGTGRIAVSNTLSIDTWQNPVIMNVNQNLLTDPLFQQNGGTLPDATIIADTATITSRLTGTNIQLSSIAGVGTNYLKATKGSTSSAFSAAFIITAPLKGKSARAGMKISVKSNTAGPPAGNINLYFGYCAFVPTSATNTVPTLANAYFPSQGPAPFNPTTSFVEYSAAQYTAPSWATHAMIYVEMGQWGANGNSLVFSTPVITEM